MTQGLKFCLVSAITSKKPTMTREKPDTRIAIDRKIETKETRIYDETLGLEFPRATQNTLHDRILEDNDSKWYRAVVFNEMGLKESENYKPYIEIE